MWTGLYTYAIKQIGAVSKDHQCPLTLCDANRHLTGYHLSAEQRQAEGSHSLDKFKFFLFYYKFFVNMEISEYSDCHILLRVPAWPTGMQFDTFTVDQNNTFL
jgi:hypothetical protein